MVPSSFLRLWRMKLRACFCRIGSLFRLRSPLPAEFLPQLGLGEREAILLAAQIHPEALLLDDLPARRAAVRLGLRISGVIGTLIAAKRLALIPEIRPDLDSLRAFSFHTSAELYRTALKIAGEL